MLYINTWTYCLRKNCCVNTGSWKRIANLRRLYIIYCNKSDLNYVCIYSMYKKCQIKVETTLRFQRWNNTEISTWNNVEIMSRFQRWNNVETSTSIQLSNPTKIQRHFHVEARRCSTLGQRWNACWVKYK